MTHNRFITIKKIPSEQFCSDGKQEKQGEKMKKIYKKLSTLAVLTAIALFGTVAYAKSNLSVTNTFQTGGVDISVSQSDSDNATITPNMHLLQDKEITNHGADCYVRARLDCEDKELIKNINVSDDWLLYPDGYYYYRNILEEEKTVRFYDSIDIANFDNSKQGKKIHFDVTAQAIQSANFTPDWNSKSVWGNVEIKKLNAENPNVSQATQITPIVITYDSESQKLIANTENFFEGSNRLMAGDTFTDTLTINNTDSKAITLTFTQIVRTSGLPEKTGLKIMSEDNILYDENSMKNRNVNITIPAKSNSNLTFTLCIPNDIDNEFAFTNGMAEWQFTVADDNSTTPTVTTENTIIPSDTVKSGDNKPTAILSMLLCISMAVIILTIRKGGKDDSNT